MPGVLPGWWERRQSPEGDPAREPARPHLQHWYVLLGTFERYCAAWQDVMSATPETEQFQ